MKNYVVRLRDYEGNIVDGEVYSANSVADAKLKYLSRCNRLGIEIGKYDYITVEDWEC